MITLHVNGQAQSFDGDPSMPVLWYLRDVLGLTGTKFGCGVAACGACTIHLDGEAIRSCVTAISDANGKSVTTIEGLDPKAITRSKGLARAQCAAVRLLSGWPDHAGRRAAEADATSRRMPTSTERWTATFAAAAPITAFAPPSSKLRERNP